MNNEKAETTPAHATGARSKWRAALTYYLPKRPNVQTSSVQHHAGTQGTKQKASNRSEANKPFYLLVKQIKKRAPAARYLSLSRPVGDLRSV